MPRIFYGEHDRKLDYKGRLGIPDDLLTAGGQEWRRAVMVKDSSELLDGDGQAPRFVSVFDIETWEELLERAHHQMDDGESRLFMHRVVGDAPTVDVDSSNRITLPERLLRYAGIERQAGVRLVGVYNHIEVWDPDTHAAHVEALEKEGVEPRSITDLVRSGIREVS